MFSQEMIGHCLLFEEVEKKAEDTERNIKVEIYYFNSNFTRELIARMIIADEHSLSCVEHE